MQFGSDGEVIDVEQWTVTWVIGSRRCSDGCPYPSNEALSISKGASNQVNLSSALSPSGTSFLKPELITRASDVFVRLHAYVQ